VPHISVSASAGANPELTQNSRADLMNTLTMALTPGADNQQCWDRTVAIVFTRWRQCVSPAEVAPLALLDGAARRYISLGVERAGSEHRPRRHSEGRPGRSIAPQCPACRASHRTRSTLPARPPSRRPRQPHLRAKTPPPHPNLRPRQPPDGTWDRRGQDVLSQRREAASIHATRQGGELG
jgi:hypothetical protein